MPKCTCGEDDNKDPNKTLPHKAGCPEADRDIGRDRYAFFSNSSARMMLTDKFELYVHGVGWISPLDLQVGQQLSDWGTVTEIRTVNELVEDPCPEPPCPEPPPVARTFWGRIMDEDLV